MRRGLKKEEAKNVKTVLGEHIKRPDGGILSSFIRYHHVIEK